MAGNAERGRKPKSKSNGCVTYDRLSNKDRNLLKTDKRYIRIGNMAVQKFEDHEYKNLTKEYIERREKNQKQVKDYREKAKKQEKEHETELEKAIKELNELKKNVEDINSIIKDVASNNYIPSDLMQEISTFQEEVSILFTASGNLS